MADGDDALRINHYTTIRDWLRHGTSAFTRAKLSYGHGTETALDEAAFLIQCALELPIDDISPWLDCRLIPAERQQIAALISQRVATRKPAAYLTNRAYIQGQKFYVDERVIVPRSYLGELLCDDAFAALGIDPDNMQRVLDLCTGSGCLAVLAAEAFPEAAVDAVDISEDALAVARINIADYDLSARVQLVRSDLFADLPAAQYGLILSNPPYVTTAAVDAFPPEYRAEPALAHLGGDDGLDIVHRILAEAKRWLSDDGVLIVEVGHGRDALEEAYPALPFLWLDTATSIGEVFALQARDL
jgi:ribosomal protein L3 glutamine methyltransferase